MRNLYILAKKLDDPKTRPRRRQKTPPGHQHHAQTLPSKNRGGEEEAEGEAEGEVEDKETLGLRRAPAWSVD